MCWWLDVPLDGHHEEAPYLTMQKEFQAVDLDMARSILIGRIEQ